MSAVVAPQLQLRVLEALEGARRYNAWIAELTRPFLGDHPVEIGSGIGVSASLWLEGGVPRITVSDLDPGCLRHLRDRFRGDTRVTVEEIDLASPAEGCHSSLVALNVLEHIADDRGALRAGARLVRPGGRVVMFVPAFQFAAGRFDRQIGHFRRYTTETVACALTDAGLELESVRYVNAPGLVAWFVGVRLLGLVPSDGMLLRGWDRVVVPAARWLESHRDPPFGQSVLAVGRTGTR